MKFLWSVPKSRDRVSKDPIASISLISPTHKRKQETDILKENQLKRIRNRSKGTNSTLYDARAYSFRNTDFDKLNQLVEDINSEKSDIPFLSLVAENQSTLPKSLTNFGAVPVGSLLSVQCPVIPADFTTHCNVNLNTILPTFVDYPPFPLITNPCDINFYINKLTNEKKLFLNSLVVNSNMVGDIEMETREQANNPDWFRYRKGRFTASLNNTYRNKDPKTSRGFQSLARNMIIKRNIKCNSVLQYKLDYGKYYEPIALQRYEQYMKVSQHELHVQKCGFVIDHNNYVLGATPDGKVIDPSESHKLGIIEIKCSEEYKDIDPQDMVYIAKNSCLEIIDNKVVLKKKHSYYDQITMQLALTTQTWCDFIFFTSKGMVIDRIRFDAEHWRKLCDKILKFYFDYMLDIFIEQEAGNNTV